MKPTHSFHIPVMGIGYTLTTPTKVAQYGISSVVSLVDDMLMEKLRKFFSEKYGESFEEISSKTPDFRAKRITAYLNFMKKIVDNQIEKLKKSPFVDNDLLKYFELLPESSETKKMFNQMKETVNSFQLVEMQDELKKRIVPGAIDVNIMTKLDKPNFENKNEPLSQEHNDAHAALRGFANSDLNSSVVFSAGMNPKLYAYLEEFDDFFPNEKGEMNKKIIIKVSDYRSALIQGKFLAKKGLWVSEYRIESGLNCGGHAFATDGYLMGPILQEFKNNRELLTNEVLETYNKALEEKGKPVPKAPPSIKVTAQGGVGKFEEQQFLLEEYNLDSVGWGTPFLFVPEVIEIDDYTLDMLCNAKEEDLYTSDISPLNVLFNSLRGNTKDIEKENNIAKNRPGSSCPKKYLAANTEFTTYPICTASREYQQKKIAQIEELNLPEDEFKAKYDEITEKSCICVGLGTASLVKHGIDTRTEGPGISICPGPNAAYFDKRMTLTEMVDHIYGKKPLTFTNRPSMFLKELSMYITYFKKELEKTDPENKKQLKKIEAFRENLNNGIEYYKQLTAKLKDKEIDTFKDLEHSLDSYLEYLKLTDIAA